VKWASNALIAYNFDQIKSYNIILYKKYKKIKEIKIKKYKI